ncbi:MAG TPA: rubrerythrin family protein [Methanoregulaceae archaeon]|nr:rubrerythrin family protein [Methanoregulaceae archaeon]
MATMDNVKAAFAGESQANRRYLSFSEKARQDGYPVIARLFRAASDAEAIHARTLLNVMGAVGSTAEDLAASVDGETHEFTEMYPAFIREAESEGQKSAVQPFTYAMKAEEVHAELYAKAAEAVRAGKDLAAARVLLCPVCGNIALDEAPERCPICGVPGARFREVTV